MDDFVRVVLPKSYDLVVGDTFQLFYRGIIEAVNPFCYDIVSVCEVGKNYPRYFEYTPKKPVNILCVGDSLTCEGLWVREANRRLSGMGGEPCGLGLGGFNFIGTCKNDNVGFEGYGGCGLQKYGKEFL